MQHIAQLPHRNALCWACAVPAMVPAAAIHTRQKHSGTHSTASPLPQERQLSLPRVCKALHAHKSHTSCRLEAVKPCSLPLVLCRPHILFVACDAVSTVSTQPQQHNRAADVTLSFADCCTSACLTAASTTCAITAAGSCWRHHGMAVKL